MLISEKKTHVRTTSRVSTAVMSLAFWKDRSDMTSYGMVLYLYSVSYWNGWSCDKILRSPKGLKNWCSHPSNFLALLFIAYINVCERQIVQNYEHYHVFFMCFKITQPSKHELARSLWRQIYDLLTCDKVHIKMYVYSFL